MTSAPSEPLNRLSQIRDVRPECHRCLRGRRAVPQLVDQPVERNRMARLHQKQYEEGALPARGDPEDLAAAAHLERAENAECQWRARLRHRRIRPPVDAVSTVRSDSRPHRARSHRLRALHGSEPGGAFRHCSATEPGGARGSTDSSLSPAAERSRAEDQAGTDSSCSQTCQAGSSCRT